MNPIVTSYTRLFLSLGIGLFLGANAYGQTATFNSIYSILQANCTNSTCHNGSNSVVNFSGSPADVYNRLINATPTNPAAAAKGHKLVDPGYPERSFLLRKLSHPGFDNYYALDDPDEGDYMPKDAPSLANKDIELVRQWILFGANDSTEYVDPALIADFYDGQGKARVPVPVAPLASEGFQMRLGPFFLDSQQEEEYFKKQDIQIPVDQEVNRIEVFFNDESHHFIIYNMDLATVDEYDEGLRNIEDGASNMLDNRIVAAWQDAMNIKLPPTTAYYWDAGTILDLNFHLRNFDADSIMAAEVFVNVYTQPSGIADQEMISELIPIDIIPYLLGTGDVGQSLIIPNTGQEITFTDALALPFISDTWHIWLLSTHTHSRGTDYDIYTRNVDGSKGEQLFEGFYNFDYSFNQGFYDWEHPPVRYFDPLKPVPVGQLNGGLIHEAKYVNNGAQTLFWGDRTTDEMMLFFIQYTENPLAVTALDPELSNRVAFSVSPNPFRGTSEVNYTLEESAEVQVEVYNLLGKKVQTLASGLQTPGRHTYRFEPAAAGLSAGIYIVRLEVNGAITSKKVVSLE